METRRPEYNITYTEDFELVRQFVAKRANAEKRAHESLFKEHRSRITDPAFRKVFVKYYEDSLKISRFGNAAKQHKLLETALQELYCLNLAAKTNREFATQIVNEDGFKRIIANEAKNLLSGSVSFSTEVAPIEASRLTHDFVRNCLLFQSNEPMDLVLGGFTWCTVSILCYTTVRIIQLWS